VLPGLPGLLSLPPLLSLAACDVPAALAFAALEPSLHPATHARPSPSTPGGATPSRGVLSYLTHLHAPTCIATVASDATGWSSCGPLDERVEALLSALPEDRPPAELDGMSESSKGRHFYCSDEWHLHGFAPALRGAALATAADPSSIPRPAQPLGGVLIAIGSEQGYMLASWSEPELAFLLDYDPEIVALHEAIDALVLAASGPEEFVAWFAPGDASPSLRALADANVSGSARAAYRRGFGRLRRRFMALTEQPPRHGAPLWLTDTASYAVVRRLLQEGRIRHARIDLTAEVGLAAIARAVTELGLTVRVLYLSNAEQYWSYDSGFRANVAALPFDERSVVLRTLSSRLVNGDYRYNLQSALDFARRLQRPNIRRVYQFVDSRPLASTDAVELTTTLGPAPTSAERLAEVPADAAATASSTTERTPHERTPLGSGGLAPSRAPADASPNPLSSPSLAPSPTPSRG